MQSFPYLGIFMLLKIRLQPKSDVHDSILILIQFRGILKHNIDFIDTIDHLLGFYLS